MPVQLNVRSPQRSSVAAEQFGRDLGEQLNTGKIDGNAKLLDLRNYVNGKAGTAQIRVVNTTKNEDLAFRVKAFGHNKAYRQERTAETLKQLLTHAGVKQAVAASVVNRALQHNGAYRTATASMIKAILSDPTVAPTLLPRPTARRVVPPLKINPLQAPPFSPGEVLGSQFNRPGTFQIFMGKPQADRNLFVFDHAQGGRVEFRDLTQFNAIVNVRKGTVIGEVGLYDNFENKFPNAQKPLAAPRTYLLQEQLNDQAQGPYFLVPRDELIRNPEFSNKTFTVLATVVPAFGEDVDLAAAQASGASASKSLDQYVVGASSPTFQVDHKSTTQKLDDFLKAQGLMTGNELGSGAFGVVKNLGSGNAPDSYTHVVKYFTGGLGGSLQPFDLMAVRGKDKFSEGYAAYLVTSRDKQWQQPHVLAPSHYLVGLPNPKGKNDLQLIPIAELKSAVRLNATQNGPELKCYGLIMEKASGEEISKQLLTTLNTSPQRAVAAQSGLQTLRTLNTRGFVHRDIKPDNLMFDGKDVSFIDTGLLFKIKKTTADKPNPVGQINEMVADQLRTEELPILTAGTPIYMHKDLLGAKAKGFIGTQADLHAFGLVILEMEAPYVIKDMFKQKMDNPDKPFDPSNFKTRLEEVIERVKVTLDLPLLEDAVRLQKAIADPLHLANLGFQCLRKANTDAPEFTAARWANRQFSDDQYVELLSHPALHQNS